MELNLEIAGVTFPMVTFLLVLLPTLSPPLVHCQVEIDPTVKVNVSFDSGLRQDDKDLLLRLHNMYRREEFSDGMNRLEWSEFLSYHASQWVATCSFKHQIAPPWGENNYRSTYKTSIDNTIDNGLMSWHLEKYNNGVYDGVDCCSTNKQTCCYYTQLVWESSKYVGCAITQCSLLHGQTKKFDYHDAWFLACYYYPPGNVLTQQPFHREQGTCTNCTVVNPDCDAGLCYFDESRCFQG